MKNKFFNNQTGQTMIEAIVAMAIILVALIGFLSQSMYNYTTSSLTGHKRIALNLAREAIEVARQIRDSNWLKGCPDPDKSDCFLWNTGLDHNNNHLAYPQFVLAETKWKMNFSTLSFDACVANNECVLYQNSAGFYLTNKSEGNASDYYRQLDLRPICFDKNDCGGDGICEEGQVCISEQIGLRLLSRVRWKERTDWGNVVLTDNLYNWR
ncbi:MAG: type II secretion system protein [Patescibacteria group bacterium]